MFQFLREIPFYFVTNGFQKETVKSNARAVRAMIISPGLSRCSNNSVAKPLFSSIANYIMRSFGIRRNKKIVCCAMWRWEGTIYIYIYKIINRKGACYVASGEWFDGEGVRGRVSLSIWVFYGVQEAKCKE